MGSGARSAGWRGLGSEGQGLWRAETGGPGGRGGGPWGSGVQFSMDGGTVRGERGGKEGRGEGGGREGREERGEGRGKEREEGGRGERGGGGGGERREGMKENSLSQHVFPKGPRRPSSATSPNTDLASPRLRGDTKATITPSRADKTRPAEKAHRDWA